MAAADVPRLGRVVLCLGGDVDEALEDIHKLGPQLVIVSGAVPPQISDCPCVAMAAPSLQTSLVLRPKWMTPLPHEGPTVCVAAIQVGR